MQKPDRTQPRGIVDIFEKSPDFFLDRKVAVTGKLRCFTRKEVHQKLASLGAFPRRTVTTKTDYLICGEKPGIKLIQAKALGIPILTEWDLLALISLHDRCEGSQ